MTTSMVYSIWNVYEKNEIVDKVLVYFLNLAYFKCKISK